MTSFSVDLATVNLSKLASWISQNRIDPTRPITIRELRQSSCVSNVKDGVKLLADGATALPPTPLNITVSRASAAAIAAVEAAGGRVTTRYYTNFAIRQICKGKMHPVESLQSARSSVAGNAVTTGAEDGEAGQTAAQQQVGRKKKFLYRLPDPTRRKDIEYYRDPAHRGYLSHTLTEGHGPSLFFTTPGTNQRSEKPASAKSGEKAAENRIW